MKTEKKDKPSRSCASFKNSVSKFTAVTINTRPIAFYSRRSNLSLVDVNQWMPLAFVFKLRLDFEQLYQKIILNVLKQPNSKSIAVSKKRLIQCDKKNMVLRAWPAL